MRKHTLAIILSLWCMWSLAQEPDSWEHYMGELTTLEDAESGSWEQAYDVLSEMAEHPINLNGATREDLERLPFLNEQQVEDICAYVYQYGPVRSLSELSMIESLDYERRRLLGFFVYVGDAGEHPSFPSLKTIGKYGKQELIVTGNVPFYERAGDREGYLGYPYKHWTRYQFTYSDYVKAGIVGANDAGEPFFGSWNKQGYDFYSFYLVLRKLNRVKTLAVGRYRVKMGMGLVINNDFSFGKVAALSSLGRSSNTLRAHSSRREVDYLQGAAATVTVAKGTDVTLFASYRKIDATLSKSGDTIVTIRTDGYHRTESEMAHKNNAAQGVLGCNVHWAGGGFHVGATALFTAFDRELHPNKASRFRYYDPEGRQFWNMSVDYGYTSRRLSVSGETATGDCKALATLNSLSWQANGRLSLLAVQRFYSYRYYSLLSESFSDGGRVQNESGIYVGADWRPSAKLSVMVYTDYAYFPWFRYQRNAGTHVWDHLLSVAYHHKQWSADMRYRLRDGRHRARLRIGFSQSGWNCRTQADYTVGTHGEHSRGWMISEVVSYTHGIISAAAHAGYFHTDDFESRLYVYERGPLYTYGFNSYYGKGVRYALLLSAKVSKELMLLARLATTDYLDRDHISSGYQEISHSSQTDLQLQIRWKF